jgi:hypothetical protein
MTRSLAEVERDLLDAGAALLRHDPLQSDDQLADALSTRYPTLISEYGAAIAEAVAEAAVADRTGREAAP